MPKYSIRLGGNSAVKRKIIKWSDRRFPMPVQNKFGLALRTDDCEVSGRAF